MFLCVCFVLFVSVSSLQRYKNLKKKKKSELLIMRNSLKGIRNWCICDKIC